VFISSAIGRSRWGSAPAQVVSGPRPLRHQQHLYYRHPRFFAFASSIKALLALPEVPKRPTCSHREFTDRMVGGENGRQRPMKDSSPAVGAHVDGHADQMDSRRYWFIENTPRVRLVPMTNIWKHFWKIFAERCAAVCVFLYPSVRGRSGWGCRRHPQQRLGFRLGLRAGGAGAAGPRFNACPSLLRSPFSIPKARRRADVMATNRLRLNSIRRFIGNLDVHDIRAENISPLAASRVTWNCATAHARGRKYFWIHALLETAQQQRLAFS